MADKKVTIKVDLDAEPSIAKLRELKKELKEISVTDPKFAEKQQQIDDYTDALKSAKTGAGNFADILGELPGPLGEVGNKVSGTINTLKQFGGIKLESLKASFSELGKDVVDAAKGIGNLTGITKAYTTISDLLAASFTKVGIAEGYAATGAKLLSGALIATGIGALVVVLGNLVSMLMDYFDSSKRAEKAANDFSDAIKRQNELLEQFREESDKAIKELQGAIGTGDAVKIARAQLLLIDQRMPYIIANANKKQDRLTQADVANARKNTALFEIISNPEQIKKNYGAIYNNTEVQFREQFKKAAANGHTRAYLMQMYGGNPVIQDYLAKRESKEKKQDLKKDYKTTLTTI